jgi:AbrB family looped-hinge helix DNA binding protein
METTRVSSKGQVVIPKSVRDRLDLRPGSDLSVEVRGDAMVLRRVKKKELRLPTPEEVAAVAGCLDDGRPLLTPEEEDAAVAAHFRKEWSR